MNWLTTTVSLYAKVARRAAVVALSNWPVLLSLFAYVAILAVVTPIALALGIVGGFLLGFVWAACVSSFLYLVERLVRHGKVVLQDFRDSFLAYFSDVIGVMFVLWIVRLLLSMVIQTNPQGMLIALVVELFLFVFFNAVPELVYLGHHSSLDLLGESYSFISENWIEWFPPTIVAAVVLNEILGLPLYGWLPTAAKLGGAALFVYFTMVMRGLLFSELATSTRRSRAYRERLR
jgi:hypothetical protein